MDFIPRPDSTKKFGVKWIKWHIMKYPHIAMICVPVPFIIYKGIAVMTRIDRELKEGKYVPNVVMNRYAVCRPDDYLAVMTPSRYRN